MMITVFDLYQPLDDFEKRDSMVNFHRTLADIESSQTVKPRSV